MECGATSRSGGGTGGGVAETKKTFHPTLLNFASLFSWVKKTFRAKRMTERTNAQSHGDTKEKKKKGRE